MRSWRGAASSCNAFAFATFSSYVGVCVVQTSLFLKDSWIGILRVGVRTSLRDVGRGWYNLQENDWEVYQVSKLKKLLEMIKFSMQVLDVMVTQSDSQSFEILKSILM